MISHDITLEGPAARGAVIAGDVLHALLDVMIDGSRKAVRLLVEGRSTASGIVPAWLERAAAFDFIELAPGSTHVVTRAKPLREAVPEVFSQTTLPGDAVSALDVFAAGLRDAMQGNADSDRFDAQLLKSYAKFERILAKGFHTITIGGPVPVRVDHESVEIAARLRSSVPSPRQVRVTGKIEQITHSDRRFTLLLEDGSAVVGVANDDVPPERMAESFGKPVVVSGLAIFRPSGALLRVEVQRFDEPRKGSELWATMPRPLLGARAAPARRKGKKSSWGTLDDIIGEWPGDEDDDEISHALELMS